MTSPNRIADAVAVLTETEAKILARYAGGEGIEQIADRGGYDRDEVTRVIAKVAGHNRAYAKTLALGYNHDRRAAPVVHIAASGTATASTLRAALPGKPKPVADTIADLLTRAADTQVDRIVRLADRIQDLVDELEKQITTHERQAELRAEADELEARLAQIRLELGPTALARPSDAKAVRAWAKANGVECPALGQIPKAVRAAYESRSES